MDTPLLSPHQRGCRLLLLCAVLLLKPSCDSPVDSDDPQPPPQPKYNTVGNPEDVQPACQSGLALVGGGGRNNDAYRWLIQRSGGGDFVFLTTSRYSEEEDEQFFSDMLKLGAVDSITTLNVNSRARADEAEVETFIRNAELVFIDGGDQSQYYTLWKGTRLQASLQYLLQTKRIPVGGTSAGMAVLSDLAYIPLQNGVTSAEALANPFHANMDSIKNDLFDIPMLAHTLTDTHWSERNRCGRTIAFLARIIADGSAGAAEARAIACDERTAVCIDGNAQAVVFGRSADDDFAYFFSCRSQPDRCLPDQPLDWAAAVSVWKLKGSEMGVNGFNLATWQGWGGSVHEVNVQNGTLTVDIQTPR